MKIPKRKLLCPVLIKLCDIASLAKRKTYKKLLFVVIVSVAKVLPFTYNLAKMEYLTSSFQNSLVPLFTSRKYISNVYEEEIFHS